MKNKELIEAFVRGSGALQNNTGSLRVETSPRFSEVTILYSSNVVVCSRVRAHDTEPANIGYFIMSNEKLSRTAGMHKRLLLSALADYFGGCSKATEHILDL